MINSNKINTFKYCLIAFPLSFAGLPIYLHAPDYYSTIIGLKIEIIGFALLFLRFIDAMLDPMIGYFSDYFFKYRALILYIGSILLLAGFLMIFNPLERVNLVLWFCLSIFLCTFGYSILIINIEALGSLWDISRNELIKVITMRESIGIFGLLFASIFPTLLYYFQNKINYNILFLILLFLLVISLFLFIHWIKLSKINTPNKFFKPSFDILFPTKKIKLFFIAYFLNNFASAIPASLIIFYVRDYLDVEHLLGWFLMTYLLSGALLLPIWQKLALKFSCFYAWLLSMIFSLITFICAFFLNAGNFYGFFVVCLLSGISVGANLALPSVIIANYINDNKVQVFASSYYSITTFISKFSLALAAGVSLPLLGFFGYIPGEVSSGMLFPVIYALLPCLILCCSIVLVFRVLRSW